MWKFLYLLAVFAAINALTILPPPPLDCSVVLCVLPECDEDEIQKTLPGECCPTCVPAPVEEPDCSAVICPSVLCAPGYYSEVPDGQCCPTCVPAPVEELNCSTVLCPAVRCALGYRSEVPDGQCCPTCVIDKCFGVLCASPDCPNPVVPEGECCPECEPDCSAVLCLKPVCKVGQVVVVPEGECCPVCEPDCSTVDCAQPMCTAGSVAVTPEGECCPKCEPDCSLVDCALPACKSGERVEIPTGSCCPICVPDPTCAAASCIVPECRRGEVLTVPEGECCPVCTCEIQGQNFSDCASVCPATCEQPLVLCKAVCMPGCKCEDGFVVDRINKVCTTVDECPDELCPVKGQVQSSCAGCETTCAQLSGEEEPVFCPAVCRLGCTCPAGQVVDTVKNECVEPSECPGSSDPCSDMDCPSNSQCKVDKPTGEAFCEPSCSINNGGCPSDQTCSLQTVHCVTSPCPPVVQCTDPCDECTDDQICSVRTLPCFIPPCPLVADCLPPEEVCALPPKAGPCEALIPRYFHNSTSKQCEKFTYGGCQGNANNFEELEECQGKCEDTCSLRPAVGLCDGVFNRYFYNTTSKQCELFIYGGCGGNSNNFQTLTECQKECSDTCSLPPETGLCKAYFLRYFHNATSGQCEQFVYGGCGGNSNNFQTASACQDECGGESAFAPTPPPTPSTCPPTCSKELCNAASRFTVCSNPGPREIPGCTGSCQLSYCGACYVSEEALTTPSGLSSCRQCGDLSDYTSDSSCYRRWTRCAARRHKKEHGKVNFNSPGTVRCYTPPCPLRG